MNPLPAWASKLITWESYHPCHFAFIDNRLICVQVWAGKGDLPIFFYTAYAPSGARWDADKRAYAHRMLHAIEHDIAERGDIAALLVGDLNLQVQDSAVLAHSNHGVLRPKGGIAIPRRSPHPHAQGLIFQKLDKATSQPMIHFISGSKAGNSSSLASSTTLQKLLKDRNAKIDQTAQKEPAENLFKASQAQRGRLQGGPPQPWTWKSQPDDAVILIRLLDIEKAYPWVRRDTLWKLMSIKGAPEGCVKNVRGCVSLLGTQSGSMGGCLRSMRLIRDCERGAPVARRFLMCIIMELWKISESGGDN